MKRFLVRISGREDQTLIHVVALYLTVIIAALYSAFLIGFNQAQNTLP